MVEPVHYEVHPPGTETLLVEALAHLRRFSPHMRQADAARNFNLAERIEHQIMSRRTGPNTLSTDGDGGMSLGFKR